MSEVPLYAESCGTEIVPQLISNILDGPASGGKGSKGGPYQYCNPRT